MGQTRLRQNQMKGMGAWTAFTPNWTNLTVGSATNTGQYCQIGKTVFFRTQLTFAANTSISGIATLTLPVATITASYIHIIGHVSMYDDSTSIAYEGNMYDVGRIFAKDASGTYLKWAGTSSTIPFTWATSDQIVVYGEYEAA